ncbi:MAG: HD domain-containing protein, partial [Ignavibacteria bacterium]
MNEDLKISFQKDREKLFNKKVLLRDGFKFCIELSLLTEEYIIKILGNKKYKFSILASGGFSRRELSPYSDIDIMFLLPDEGDYSEEINEIITSFWDAGIEISHTVRTMSDAERFLEEDLHSFTQFFETRFLYGSKRLFNSWNNNLFKILSDEKRKTLIHEYIEDFDKRHKKYGDSPKVLEPNIKYTAGGLRDLQSVEWMYSIKNNLILSDEQELTQTELFLKRIKDEKIISPREYKRIKQSYEYILRSRNLLHFVSERRNDRMEFRFQEKIAKLLDYDSENWKQYMVEYFNSSSIVNRFSKTMMKKFLDEITQPLSDYLTIELDEDFALKGGRIITKRKRLLSHSSLMRAFYYRGLHSARFDKEVRSLITESVLVLEEESKEEKYPTVFFREILKLPNNVADTLAAMNELGVLGLFLPEWKDLVGFYQPGVYHCYTADEHTLIALKNLEALGESSDRMGIIFKGTERKDLLFMGILLHDIAKPISVSGHEIIGAEYADTICARLGYNTEEVQLVKFLVHHHLIMEQVAFRRNLNDPVTLNNFASQLPSVRALNMLYLLTFADLSAVSPVIWTQWKSDLLYELYSKTLKILQEDIDAESLLNKEIENTTNEVNRSNQTVVKEHINAIDDLSYFNFFSEEEIKEHAEIIGK